MKKILLVGELNNALHTISENLINDFQVQMCSEQPKNIKDMITIMRPNLIVINLIGIEKGIEDIFTMLKEKHDQMPVLVLCTGEKKEQYSESFSGFKNINFLYRPILKDKLIEKCYEMLGVAKDDINAAQENVKKILVIDDSPLLLRNMRNMLEPEFKVFIATSGEQGVEFVKEKKPDLILLDYDMPGWDGRKTFEVVRQTENGKDIPVIFLTAIADKENIMAVLQMNPYGYLLKPPVRETLIEQIRNALN